MQSLSNKEQRELVQLLKKGDMTAFDAIYSQYCKRLFRFVLRYIKNEEDAEEIVQDVFVKLWVTRNNIDEHYSFESFLFTITYNATISLLRKKVNETKYVEYLRSIQQVSSAESIIEDISYKELSNNIQSLLEQLTPRQREIFKLSREEGLSHAEIAERLNISTSTVKNHIVSTLSFFKSKINNELIVSALILKLFFFHKIIFFS